MTGCVSRPASVCQPQHLERGPPPPPSPRRDGGWPDQAAVVALRGVARARGRFRLVAEVRALRRDDGLGRVAAKVVAEHIDQASPSGRRDDLRPPALAVVGVVEPIEARACARAGVAGRGEPPLGLIGARPWVGAAL